MVDGCGGYLTDLLRVECCGVVSVDGGDKEEQPACVSESVECCDVVSGDGGDKEEQRACV